MRNKTKLPNIYLGLLLVFMYLPILFVIVYSFNANKLTAIWSGFSLQWYRKLMHNAGIMEALKNSLVLATLSCALAAVIGTVGAVGMARAKYKGMGIMEYISTIPIMIPEIILGMIFLAYFSMLNLPAGMFTLVIAHTTFCIPYIYMLVKARLVGMDPALVEAARDLGASEVRAFFDVTLPLIMPAIASGVVLAFAMSLDDVVISIFVTGPRVTTLPIKIYTQMKFGVTPEINALCTVMLGVTIVLLVLSARLGSGKTESTGVKKKKMEENL